MINVTNHCFEKYCERILNIEDLKTAKQYIVQNRDKLYEDINKLFEHATLIYVGQINGDKSTKNYYLRDNIVMVVDTADTNIITLYRINFGFSEDIDRLITANLISEITELNSKKETLQNEIAETIESKKAEISNIDLEVEKMKEYIKSLELKKSNLDNEIKIANTDISIVSKEIEGRAVKICNSLEYRKDLLGLNNK